MKKQIDVYTDNDIYNKLVKNMEELYPQLKIKKLGDDYMLYNEYDINSVSTKFVIKTDVEEIDEILKILLPYRVTEEERASKEGERYQCYLKYGWMWDFFDGLKKCIGVKKEYCYDEKDLIDREHPADYYARLAREAEDKK